jgi:membrane associated rhomboid family serine protease
MDDRRAEATVEVFATADREMADHCSLVLSAAAIDHEILHLQASPWTITVAEDQSEQARREILAYIEENRDWPPPAPARDTYRPAFQLLSPFIACCLVLIFLETGDWRPESAWFAAGAGDSAAILEGGEYYRLLTALTLHADITHLLGNCLLGLFLLHYLFQLLGNGIGLSGMLAAAALANLANVAVHGPGHHFVGFSTAIFATIGILSSLNFRRHTTVGRTRLLMPLMAGLALLAVLGSEGERTDLGAHFFGLVIGLLTGYFFSTRLVQEQRGCFWLQTLLTCTALMVFFLAWRLALA